MNSPNSVWLSSREAVLQLGIKQRTRYRLIDEDRILAYRLGRVIRLKVNDLKVFVGSSRVTPGFLKDLYSHPQKLNDSI